MSAIAWRPPMPNEGRELLREARRAHVEDKHKARLAGVVQSAVDVGWSCTEIGELLGFSREYARQLDNHRVEGRYLVNFPPKPRRPRPVAPKRWTPPSVRVTENLTDAEIAELKELHQQARRTNGATPVGDPRRIAGDKFWSLCHEIMTTGRAQNVELAAALGISAATIPAGLARRGFRDHYPSQPYPYRNRQTDHTATRKFREEATHCRHGHEYSSENTGVQKAGRYCKQCRKNRRAEHYAATKGGTND